MKSLIYLTLYPIIMFTFPLPLLSFMSWSFINILIILNQLPLFYSMKIMLFTFMDYPSFLLITLTLWILNLMILAWNNMPFKKLYLITIYMLTLSLMTSFMAMNFFTFYFFFEVSMIPTLMLILGWGGQYERLEASMYMFMYTIFGSLPLMMILINIHNYMNTLNLIIIMNYSLINNIYSYLYIMLSFLIKLPMFSFHLWLPKAHVEAPITGSMILAAILLKLGSYGIIRINTFMELTNLTYSYLLITFSLMGSMMMSLVCLKQIDMKKLVAYSSIVHMSMLLSGLLTLTFMGHLGAMIMMISHGLTSSALFFIVNIIYSRKKTRSMLMNKGLMNMTPSLSLFWFLLCISNMASPPTLSMYSEIFLINSILKYSFNLIYIIIMLSFFSVLYSMMFFSLTQHGYLNKNINIFMNINIQEFLTLMLHLYPIMTLFF